MTHQIQLKWPLSLALLDRLIHSIRRRIMRKRVRLDVQNLSDRTLRDIGLQPDDVRPQNAFDRMGTHRLMFLPRY